jgi:hypothetical protein
MTIDRIDSSTGNVRKADPMHTRIQFLQHTHQYQSSYGTVPRLAQTKDKGIE